MDRRVFVHHYETADNLDSPVLTLDDVTRGVLSSENSILITNFDPLKSLQSLEDLRFFPQTKYYWCHLVSRQEKATKNNPNNCIWGSWVFHQYFDALNLLVQIPLIAIKYVGTAEHPETIITGVTRKKVTSWVEFENTENGKHIAKIFQVFMKFGTKQLSETLFESFIYPENPVEMRTFLEIKYNNTMGMWGRDGSSVSEDANPVATVGGQKKNRKKKKKRAH